MSDASRRMGKLVREGWTEIVSVRLAGTLQTAGFPIQYVQVHALECRYFTRPWVMRLYAALPGTNPLLNRVGTVLRAELSAEACEAAERLGGVEAVVALAQGLS